MSTVYEVTCRTCGRTIGLSSRRPRDPFYCDAFCGSMPAETPNDERDTIMEFLIASGYSYSQVGGVFDVSPQRVFQIVEHRKEGTPSLRALRTEELTASA